MDPESESVRGFHNHKDPLFSVVIEWRKKEKRRRRNHFAARKEGKNMDISEEEERTKNPGQNTK